jgi:hypothetical protein
MPRHAILRLLDGLFRHPVLHLLPLIGFAMLGTWYVTHQPDMYRSGGVVLVDDQTLLASLTGIRGIDTGWETPAQYTSGQLNALLQTDAFVLGVAVDARLGDPLTLKADDLRRLRGSLGSSSTGRDLLYVWAEHTEPETAKELADATIQRLIDWRLDSKLSDSASAEDFLSPIRARYREELSAARQELADFLAADREADGRAGSDDLALEELRMAVTAAQVRYSEAFAKEETARLSAAQAESDIRNQLQVLDAPTVPESPQTSLRNLAVALLAFLAVGAMLSLASIALSVLADPTVRFREDVEYFGVEVLAEVAATPGSGGRS